MSEVIITRLANDTVGGVRRSGRVYITGPHRELGADIYSSTESRGDASTFTREEADALLRKGKWQGCAPVIEDVPDA